jgi:uncharacterized membrane protein
MSVPEKNPTATDSPGALPVDRIEAFSDGVFGDALTLLVLDLHVPHGLGSEHAIWAAMREILPSFLGWIISFTFVLTIWINHHYFFHELAHGSRVLLWLNGLLLLSVTFLPFPTSMLAEYPNFMAPEAVLSATMLVGCLTWIAMRIYAANRVGLLHRNVSPERHRSAMTRSVIGAGLYAVALVLSFVSAYAAMGVQIVTLVMFVVEPAWLRHPARRLNV